MHKYIKKMKSELDKCGKMPLFEIPVVKTTTGEADYILCDISFHGNSIICQRDAVSAKERRSKFIARTRVVCDSCLSLDGHLQELYDRVVSDIGDAARTGRYGRPTRRQCPSPVASG